MSSSPPFDAAKTHSWLAIELNNLAWDLIEQDERSADEIDRLLHAAHASTWHWLQVGDDLNRQRAHVLVASAYVVAGFHEPALRFAKLVVADSERNGDRQTAFDRATAYGVAARAHVLGDDRPQAVALYERAVEAAKAFDHPSERPLFDKLYPAP